MAASAGDLEKNEIRELLRIMRMRRDLGTSRSICLTGRSRAECAHHRFSPPRRPRSGSPRGASTCIAASRSPADRLVALTRAQPRRSPRGSYTRSALHRCIAQLRRLSRGLFCTIEAPRPPRRAPRTQTKLGQPMRRVARAARQNPCACTGRAQPAQPAQPA